MPRPTHTPEERAQRESGIQKDLVGLMNGTYKSAEVAAREWNLTQRLSETLFGGAPLVDGIGNKLVDQGVRIHCCYGATEVGHVHEVWDSDVPRDWGHVKFLSHVDVRFIPQNDADETFELAFVVSEDYEPFIINCEINGKPAYKTKDLVVRHPNKPELWKIFGRLDDQMVLHNDKKINPGPIENEIARCAIVRCAVMFGRERNQTGVLIQLEESANVLYKSREGRARVIDEIWPFIECANDASPTHSGLEKQTIILVDPARPLPRTPKGNISRPAAVKLYALDIEEMYLELEKGSGAIEGTEPPHSWITSEDVETWITRAVKSLLGREINVSGDLFQQGMDSLTSAMLLRILKSTLHSSNPHVRSASININQQTIFDNPTVQQLARLLVHISKDDDPSVDPVADSLQAIKAMIQKYDSDWHRQEAHTTEPVKKERVVVTGTTGGLEIWINLWRTTLILRIYGYNLEPARDRQP
ncbi:hypothetical protein OPQ81_007304 [Rhizoctonia solani]|nr:hypothetical protein OPQ81_007304 [Rhizoctonia solani]